MRKIGLSVGLALLSVLTLTACGSSANGQNMEWYGTSLGDVMCFESSSSLNCNFETLSPSLTKTNEDSTQLEIEWVKSDGAKIPCFKKSQYNYMACYWKGVQIPDGVEQPEWVKEQW